MEIPSSSGPSYAQLLAAGHRLFWKHGISRVTVTEICREAGVSKMTFYRYFSSKNALAKAVLSQVMAEARARYQDIMTRDISFAERIRETVLLKLEGTQDISEELITDIYKNPDPDLMDFMAAAQAQVIEETLAYYRTAQEQGELRSDFNPALMLFVLEQIQEWVTRPELVAMYPQVQDRVMALTRFFFYGIAGQQAETGSI